MYAIIETGGKQYSVTPGGRVRVEKLEGKVGSKIEFDRVLLMADGEAVTVGTPVVTGAKVTSKITAQGRHPKLIVFKMRRRKNSKRKQGHRQSFTEVEVTGISG